MVVLSHYLARLQDVKGRIFAKSVIFQPYESTLKKSRREIGSSPSCPPFNAEQHNVLLRHLDLTLVMGGAPEGNNTTLIETPQDQLGQ